MPAPSTSASLLMIPCGLPGRFNLRKCLSNRWCANEKCDCSSLKYIAGKGCVFLADTHAQHRGIQQGKSQRVIGKSEGKRQHSDLANDDRIIGMIEKTVGSGMHQWRIWQHDDPRRPAV